MTDHDGPDPDRHPLDGATGDPDADKKLIAFERWSRENRSMAWIAEANGISRSTAHRWVHEGEEIAAQLPLLDTLRGRRNEIEFTRMIKEWMVELRTELDPVDQIRAAEVALKASERNAKLGGYDAPVRTDSTLRTSGGPGPVVEGSVARGVDGAVELYRRGGDPHDRDSGQGGGPGRSW